MTGQQTKFKTIVSDHDTALFRAAKFVQEDYVIVTNNKTGVSKEYKNQTEFWGHHAKKEGGWLAETNSFLGTEVSSDDFTFEMFSRLDPTIDNHLEEAEKNFDISVGALKSLGYAKDYLLVIGGEGNFRYDAAMELPYKGDRSDKPLLFKELKELIMEKYAGKLIIADGREADDVISQLGVSNALGFMKTGVWEYLFSYIDKDLKMIYSPSVNPDKKEEGITYNTQMEAVAHYCKQLIIGDKSVDNIPGLCSMSNDLRGKYDIRKGKTVGEKTAEALLETSESIKGLFERVIEAYKDCYGEDEIHEFTNFRGDKLEWTWKDYLRNRATLLWMHRDLKYNYDIFTDTLDKVGVEY